MYWSILSKILLRTKHSQEGQQPPGRHLKEQPLLTSFSKAYIAGLNRSSFHFRNSVHLLQLTAALKWSSNCLQPFRHENLPFSPSNDWNEGVSLFLTLLIFTWYLLMTIHSLHYLLYTDFSLTSSLRNSTFQLGHKYDIHPGLNYMQKLLLLKTIMEVEFLLWVNSPHFTEE